MNTFCVICNRNYATSFNYKRHMETTHPDGGVKRDDSEEDGDSETDSDNEESERSDSDESNENSDDGEDTNDYTYDEVRAIVRFVLKSKAK